MISRSLRRGCIRAYSAARTAKFDAKLKPSEVLVNVEAHTVRYSHYIPSLADFGTELVGTIEKVGEDSDFSPGDRIFAGTSRTANLNEPVLLHNFDNKVMILPETLSAPDALASVGNYALGYMALKRLALEKQGNSILLLGQNRSLSAAILDLADNLFECEVTGVSDDKLILERFEEDGCEALNWKAADFPQNVLDRTFGKGTDFVIDTVGGDALGVLQKCVKPNGLIFLLDQSSGKIPVIDSKTLIERNSSISSLSIPKQNPADVRQAFHMAIQILESGMPRGVKPIVVETEEEARKSLVDNKLIGQVVMIHKN
ncbi:unnamed protein product [Bursaphelenchus xylophilus]|uniref:(pine wood nematode) hypothetical protein n=1 Tax=Bursaphelenchus xylophilus TaxID=6326 RepID=A0A1I7RUI5_BURXY|nr:unnamed protein product [Bursaphelenchus xylophilus]CAG9114152.1 unnamed protein product [Bursaphelenchus xylophilus]